VSQGKGTKTRVVVYFDTRGIQVVGENEDSDESILNNENEQLTHHWEKRKLPMTDVQKRCLEFGDHAEQEKAMSNVKYEGFIVDVCLFLFAVLNIEIARCSNKNVEINVDLSSLGHHAKWPVQKKNDVY